MTKEAANSKVIGRVLVAILILGFVYVASLGPAWSIAARTKLSPPFTWAIYKPIPFGWKLRVAQFWLGIDPKLERYTE